MAVKAGALALALGAVAGPASAQLSTRGGPLDLSSDAGSADMKACSAELRGRVEALQGEARLRAERLSYLAEKLAGADGAAECGEALRLEAHGEVRYATPVRSARADHAVYDARTGDLVLTGDVVVVQGRNVQRSDRLVINNRAGSMRTESEGQGRRVRMVIYPTERSARTASAR